MDRETALVGAPRDEDPHGTFAGSAYVFERSDGNWTQQAKLTAEDGNSEDQLGFSVALDNGTALVGAPGSDASNADAAGVVYVFERSDGSWTQQATLVAADGDSDDLFGTMVALDGGTALVGAPGDEDPNGDQAGSAYVFERSDGSWTQQAKLMADDGDSKDVFGASVALDSGKALVGTPSDEDPNGDSAGSAYVFERLDGSWTQQAKLTADDGDATDRFGARVGLESDTLLVGAPSKKVNTEDNVGAAYVFELSNGNWTQQATLRADDGDAGDVLGGSVGLDGGAALVGAIRDEDPNGDRAGSAYVFEQVNGSWTQLAKLVADDGDSDDLFGWSIDLQSGTALIGAVGDEDPNGDRAGSAYVFAV